MALDDPESTIEDIRDGLDTCAESDMLDILADLLIPDLITPEDEFEREGFDPPGHVFEVVARATAVAQRSREVATAEYLAAVLRERCGEPAKAEEHLKRANAANRQIGPIVERLGWYCFDRGDARGAMKWWNELEGTHEGAAAIAEFLTPDTGAEKTGRNDPCWCESGRKFKHCHQNQSALPALPDRVGWLARKASLWIDHSAGHQRDELVRCAIAYALGDPDPHAYVPADLEQIGDDVADAFDDPIIVDAVLYEGGFLPHFIRDRGALLPEDEQLLLASWQLADRSVHEIIAVDPGLGFTARNLATGDELDVRERIASQQIAVGERYCARLVPDGVSNQIVGGVFAVRVGREEEVLDLCERGDPLELCAYVGATMALQGSSTNPD